MSLALSLITENASHSFKSNYNIFLEEVKNTSHKNFEIPSENYKLDDLIAKIKTFIEENKYLLIEKDGKEVPQHFNNLNEVLLIKKLRQIKANLNEWLEKNPSKNSEEAAYRIRQVIYQQSDDLELNKLELTSIPSCIGDLSFLELLGLDENLLTELPKSLSQLQGLQILSATSNHLKKVSVSGLAALKHLYLSSNKLNVVPEDLDSCKNLETLVLSRNNLTKFPRLDILSKLTSLSLSGNKLESMDSVCALGGLKYLSLSENLLREVPAAIQDLHHLEKISLSVNRLKTLPQEIGTLNFKALSLRNNQLINIQPICSIISLQLLNLSGNCFKKLPEEITNLKNLTKFKVNVTVIVPETLKHIVPETLKHIVPETLKQQISKNQSTSSLSQSLESIHTYDGFTPDDDHTSPLNIPNAVMSFHSPQIEAIPPMGSPQKEISV